MGQIETIGAAPDALSNVIVPFYFRLGIGTSMIPGRTWAERLRESVILIGRMIFDRPTGAIAGAS